MPGDRDGVSGGVPCSPLAEGKARHSGPARVPRQRLWRGPLLTGKVSHSGPVRLRDSVSGGPRGRPGTQAQSEPEKACPLLTGEASPLLDAGRFLAVPHSSARAGIVASDAVSLPPDLLHGHRRAVSEGTLPVGAFVRREAHLVGTLLVAQGFGLGLLGSTLVWFRACPFCCCSRRIIKGLPYSS